MGLATAHTPGVTKTGKYGSNWSFKSSDQLKMIYDKLFKSLQNEKFGEYISISYLFGEQIAHRLAQDQQFLAPVV
jgi:hypothetical protein